MVTELNDPTGVGVGDDGLPALPPPADEPPQDAIAAAAAVAAAGGGGGDIEDGAPAPPTLEANMKKLQDQQLEQAQIIINMQNTIHNLSAKQAELVEEVEGLKSGQWVVSRAEPSPKRGTAVAGAQAGVAAASDGVNEDQAQALLAVGSTPTKPPALGFEETTDEVIDHIIASRTERKLWPLKRKYCTSFSQEVDLMKIRFHNSDKYDHKRIRIPKIDKGEGQHGAHLGNKEGRLICRLCSGKTINRNTSWMCATCVVPLCVDIVNGDAETSCHARWHACHDLISVNASLNQQLRERRESKKRSRTAIEAAEIEAAEEVHHQHQETAEALAASAAAAVGEPEMEPMKMEEMVHHHEQAVDDAELNVNL